MSMNNCLQVNKKISIVVPIYNTEEKQLCECIDSLKFQTYSNIEIILIDDGSDKYVENICKEYLIKDDRIKYFKKENGGVSSSRNLGISKAIGSYIMFVDADDWIDINCCEELAKYLNDDYDIISFSYVKEYEKHSEFVEIFNKDISENMKSKKTNLYIMPILGTSCMKLYRKNVIQQRKFDETLRNAEDVEFNFRIFSNAKNFYFINKNFYHYRIQNKSAVRRFDKNMIENYEKTIEKVRQVVAKNLDECNEIAYYSFLAITYLMICLNYVFNSDNHIRRKRKILTELSKKPYVKELFDNTNKINLPMSRKLPILFGKFKMYFMLSIVIKIKKIMDKM